MLQVLSVLMYQVSKKLPPFSAFGNGGEYYKPQYISKITDQSGAVKEFKNSSSTAMKSSTAFMLTNMMKSVITDSYAKIINTSDYAQAGKTGVTAYDDSLNMPDKSASDAWFTGFTKTAAISVWTGYDEPNEEGHSLASGEQQFTPLRVYKALMDYIMSGAGADGSDWDMPNTVKSSTVNGVKEYSVVGADTSSEKTISQAVKKSSSRSTPSRSSSSAQPSSSSESSETPSSKDQVVVQSHQRNQKQRSLLMSKLLLLKSQKAAVLLKNQVSQVNQANHPQIMVAEITRNKTNLKI